MNKTIRIKLLLVFLSVLFVLSGAILFVTRAENKNASAATAITAVSMAKGSTENGFYRYEITLTGYTAVSDYRKYNKEVAADGVVVPDYVELNGKSVTAWNTEYAATADSWTFEKFPTTAAGYYYHMPIFFQGSASGYIKMYIHTQMYNAIKAEYGLVDIRVRKGLNLENGSYTLGFDSSIFVIKSDRTIVPISDASITQVAATDVNVNVSRWQVNSDLYYFDVYFPGFGASSEYNIMKPAQNAYYYISSIIHVNGVSAKYINEHTDVSGYSAWNVFPQTSGDARYLKPFLFYSNTNGMLNVRMKNDWWNANKVNNAMTISFVPHVYVTRADGDGGGIYTMAEEVKFIRDSAIGESSYTAAGWKDLRNSAVVITESNANRPYSASEKTWYFKVNFAGFTTTGYDAVNVAAVNDNILINGKTVTQINSDYATAAAGWTWAKFPQSASASYAKPVLNYVNEKGVMQMQMHENLYNALKDEYGLIDITVKNGFTFGGYTVASDCKYVLDASNVFLSYDDAAITKVSASSISVSRWLPSSDLYYFDVYFPGFEAGRAYDIMDKSAYKYIANLIHINGVSAKYINENTDVSGYSAFTVSPSSGTGNSTYNKPFMLYVKTAGGRLEIRMKNDWWNANKSHNSMNVSVVPGVYVTTASGIYVAEEEVVYYKDPALAEGTTSADAGWLAGEFTLTEVGASDVNISVDNSAIRPYSQAERTYYFNVSFAGFTTTGYDAVNVNDVNDYIKINGKTINELNAEYATAAASWTWGKFPQNADAKYKKPILNYVGTAGTLQLQMHEELYYRLEGVKITVCAGLYMDGYLLTEDKEMVFKEASDGSSSAFINESDITYVSPIEISVSDWLGDVANYEDVIIFYVHYAPFQAGTDYKLMDVAAYYYLANIIHINGVSMRYWNLRTNISDYSAWTSFPSTANAIYKVPFVTYIQNAGTMEIHMKKDWYNANKDANGSITVSVVPGTFITADDVIYGVKSAATYVYTPANASWSNDYGRVLNGAYVRMITNAGLRFCAFADKTIVDDLRESGATVKLMMKVSRQGSSKVVEKECTYFYEEDGYYRYNVVIIGLAATSYGLDFTAQPFIRVVNTDTTVSDIYLGSVSRNITEVATAALNDLSDSEDDTYKYEISLSGVVKYSPYSAAQREILLGYAPEIIESQGVMYTYNKETPGYNGNGEVDNFLIKGVGTDADEVNEFFDDFAERYLYSETNNGKYVTATAVGSGSISWKDWESTALLYLHSDNISGGNTGKNDQNYASHVANAVVDKYGYVWEGYENAYFAQGWNLPDYTQSRLDGEDSYKSDGWEFKDGRKNSSILAIDSGATGSWGACSNNWTITSNFSGFNASTHTDINNTRTEGKNNGYYYIDVPDSKTSTHNVVFSVSDNGNNGVFVSSSVKFVELGIDFHKRSGSFDSITFSFKNGSGNTYTLDLDTWATTSFSASDIPIGGSSVHLFIPVFEHANWTGNIKQISITFNGTFTGLIYLDYVRGCFDVRMADTNTSFINAGKSHFENTGSVSFLTANLPKYRQAMQFLISYMTDASGIINLSKLQGHNGSAKSYGTSIISTYWDILSLAPNSSYVNALYYKALLDMAYLEEVAAANGINVAKPSVVSKLSGGTSTTYNETATMLRAKAAAVKTAINANLNTASHTGYFKTTGANAGYFVDGYANGNLIDFGSVAFNLIIIDTGLATDEHAEMILNWMLTIDDLYEYMFAPKTNATDVGSQIVWAHSSVPYGTSVQNGGAILFVSYYDILARLKVYGADNAYQRLSEIIAWYNDVKNAYENSEYNGSRTDFFRAYYETHSGSLQGNGAKGNLGLHAEFIENAMLMAVVPDGFFGLSTKYDTTDNKAVLVVEPNLPNDIAVWKMEDVRYLGIHFDIVVADSFVMIKSVENNILGGTIATDKAKIQITLHYTGDTPNVYLNGTLITSGYITDTTNKTITYTSNSPFAALTLVVR